MKHAQVSDELLEALIDAFDHLDIYLLAYWDDVQRSRVKKRVERVNALLREERKARRLAEPSND